jgi:hypothetical protein
MANRIAPTEMTDNVSPDNSRSDTITTIAMRMKAQVQMPVSVPDVIAAGTEARSNRLVGPRQPHRGQKSSEE